MFKKIVLCFYVLTHVSFSLAQERIVYGEQVDSTLSGIVRIKNTNASDGNSGCSGYLLSSSWIITAAHCFDGGADPKGIEVYMESSSYPQVNQIATASEVFIHPKFLANRDTQYDIAMIRILDKPFFSDRFTLTFRKGFYVGELGSLIGKTVSCYGYGKTENAGELGILKVAKNLKVAGLRINQINLNPNSSGAMINSGDSGGPCFIEKDGKKQLVAINTSVTPDLKNGYALTHKGFKDFILNTMYKDPIKFYTYGKRWMYNDDSYEFGYFYPNNFGVLDKYEDQCAGSKYDLSYDINFGENDKLAITGTQIVKEPYCGMFGCGVRDTEVVLNKSFENTSEIGAITDVVGQITYEIQTNMYGVSRGINSLKATCEAAIQCQENICFMNSHKTVNGVNAGAYPSEILPKNVMTKAVEWDPCFGSCYTYKTQSRFANTNGWIRLSKYNGSNLESFDSFGGTGSHTGRACGKTYIEVYTGNSNAYAKGFEISATCDLFN